MDTDGETFSFILESRRWGPCVKQIWSSGCGTYKWENFDFCYPLSPPPPSPPQAHTQKITITLEWNRFELCFVEEDLKAKMSPTDYGYSKLFRLLLSKKMTKSLLKSTDLLSQPDTEIENSLYCLRRYHCFFQLVWSQSVPASSTTQNLYTLEKRHVNRMDEQALITVAALVQQCWTPLPRLNVQADTTFVGKVKSIMLRVKSSIKGFANIFQAKLRQFIEPKMGLLVFILVSCELIGLQASLMLRPNNYFHVPINVCMVIFYPVHFILRQHDCKGVWEQTYRILVFRLLFHV